MQGIVPMCSFDASKSTKGASKLRRDLINAEIGQLRDLLPLPASTRQRLSQLQLMALVCVYVRKANYFQQVLKREQESLQHQQQAVQSSSGGLLLPLLQQPQHQQHGHAHHLFPSPIPPFGFSKAMNGFLMMLTQSGKLLYISDNAAEYLGHSMEDLLIHGDSVYDMIDKQDHAAVQAELSRAVTMHSHTLLGHSHPATSAAEMDPNDTRLFLCRMNVSRNARRQMRFGDQKVILVEGKFASFLPLCSRNEPVLVGVCTPVAMPETRECVVQGATNMFTSHHSMDMTITTIDANGEFYLGYNREELIGVSWYQLLHWDHAREAQAKHRMITQSEQERSCIVLLRLQCRNGSWLWVHTVLQVKEASDPAHAPFIVATNQVLTEREAAVMRANSWLYHYYLVHTKVQYGLAPPYDNPPSRGVSPFYSPQAAAPTTPTPTTPLPSGSGGASATLSSLFQPHAHLLPSPHHHYHHPPHLATSILEASPLSTTPYLSLTALHSPQQASSTGFSHNGGTNITATTPVHHVTQYSFTSSPGTYQHLSATPADRGLLPNPAKTPLVSPDLSPRALPLLPLAPSPSSVGVKRKWEVLGGEMPSHAYPPQPKRPKSEAWSTWPLAYDSPEPSGDEDTLPVVPCFSIESEYAEGMVIATHRTALSFSQRRSSKTACLTSSSSSKTLAWPVSVPSPSPQRVPDTVTDNLTTWTLPVPQASPPCLLTPAATPTPSFMPANHSREVAPDTTNIEARTDNQEILDTSWLSLWVPRLSDEPMPPSPSASPAPGMLPDQSQ